MPQNLKMMLRLAAGVTFSCMAAFAQAQTYPARPVTVIVPFAPGGNLDVITRVVTTEMAKTLGQSFVIENRPGAGGLLGLGRAAKAAPDGYTLAVTASGGFAYTPRMLNSNAFLAADFAPVGMIGITPMVFEVPASSRFKTFQDFAAYAKHNPEGISVGHAGNGTTNHIAILLLQQALGVKFTIVPYSGSAPALNDLLGKQIDAIVDQIPSSLQHLRANTLRALAVTSRERAVDLPSVPTLQQEKVENFDVVTASGLLAPAGVAPEVMQTLSKALNDALKTPAVRDRLNSLGTETRPTTPQEFETFLKGEVRKADELASQGLLKNAQ